MASARRAGSMLAMTLPILTGASIRGFVGALVGGILASTFLSLGFTFIAVGPTALGISFLGVGALSAAGALLAVLTGRRDAAREDAARTARARATVLDARMRWHSRVGAHHPLRLAVSIAGTRVARTVFVLPTYSYRPGEQIQVAFAPGDPGNFLPLE